MTMTPRLRKLALTAHVASSVGWLGAVVAYLVLAVAGLTSRDAQTVRAAYLAMELVGWLVLVPLSLAALLTGLVQSLGTEWGLFRHYWVLVKFVLTVGATTVLLLHMPAVSRMAGVAAETPLAGPDFRELRVQLVVHAGGGLVVLLTATSLSVFKPWGRTPYGRRVQEERWKESPTSPAAPDTGARPEDTHARPEVAGVSPGRGSVARTRRKLYALLVVVGLVVLFLVLHLAAGGRGRH
jgi:hypothetical protein